MNEQQKQEQQEKPSNATEAGYVANQAAEASAAIGQAFAALKADLLAGVDPKTLTRQYPLVTMGAAAVAGFLAASAVVPSKEEQALKKLERIERTLRPYPENPPAVGAAPAASAANQNKSITSRIFSELFSALKPALSSALAAYAAAPDPNDANGQNGNGHAAATASTTMGTAAGNAAYYQEEEDRRRDPENNS